MSQARILIPADIDVGTPLVDTSTSNAAATIEGDVLVPKGRQLLGYLIKLGINITEAGVSTGSSFVGGSFQSFKSGPTGDKSAIEITEGSALMMAAMGEYGRQLHSYGQTPVSNKVMAASATDYWMYAFLVSPFHPDVRQATWKAQLKTIVMANFSTPTAYARNLWVAPLFTDKIMPAQRLEALAETNTRVTESDVVGFGLGIDNVELSSCITSLAVGAKDLSGANLIKAKETAFNTVATGFNTAFGTPTMDIPAPGIIAPWHATQRLFALTHENDSPEPLTIKTSSQALKWYVRKPWTAKLD